MKLFKKFKCLGCAFLFLISTSPYLYAQGIFPVRIAVDPPQYFTSLQAAYDQASSGDIIQCQALTIDESINLNRDISITLSGGYNSDFSQNSGAETVIIGSMGLTSGTVLIENTFVSFTDPANVPDIPLLLTAESLDTKAYISWGNVQNAEGYILKYGTTSATYDKTIYVEGTNYIATNLINDTTYYFAIRAYNASGLSNPSNELSVTPQPRAATAGYESVFGSVSTDGSFAAMPITMGQDGTIKSLTMFHDAGTGSMILAIYSGVNSPENLLATSLPTALNNIADWQTVNLISPVQAANGQKIWIAWLYSANPGIRYIAGTPGTYSSSDNWNSLSGTMPEQFPSSADSGFICSLYVNYIINQAPQIIQFLPNDKYTCEETGIVNIQITAEDSHYDPLEYQYLFDDIVFQSWSSNSAFEAQTNLGDFGEHSFNVQVRDDIGAVTDSTKRNVFIFRKPVSMD